MKIKIKHIEVDHKDWVERNREFWFIRWVIPDRLKGGMWSKDQVIMRLETLLQYDFEILNK